MATVERNIPHGRLTDPTLLLFLPPSPRCAQIFLPPPDPTLSLSRTPKDAALHTHRVVPDETGSTTTGGTPATKRVSNVRAVPDLRTPTTQHHDLVLATERVLKELNIALTHTAPSSLLQDVGGSSNSTRTTTRHHGPQHGPPDDGGHVINVVYTSDLMCTFRIGHTTTFGELANDVRKYFSIPYEVRFVLVDNLGVMNTPRALVASRQQRATTENDDDGHGGTREENGT